jgi:hypothetical protein
MSAIHTPYTNVCHLAVISNSSKKRWIPTDLVQNTAEYSGSVASLVSFRGVSSAWQAAVSDAVGFLNGRCWTQLEEKREAGAPHGPLWRSFCLDRHTVVTRCALLCLGRRLETLTWRYAANELGFALQLLRENNTVLTTLTLSEYSAVLPGYSNREQTADVSRLQSCRALKQLNLTDSSVTNAGIRGLELIPTLEILNLGGCRGITDVSCLQSCRVLKQLVLAGTNVTDAGIRGLELISALEELNLRGCREITDVSCLRSSRALKKLELTESSVIDAGIRGLELVPTLEELSLWDCEEITDVSRLQSCRALQKLDLAGTNVTDAGIRGLVLIPTLQVLDLMGCYEIEDLSALLNRPGLQVVSPC